MAEEKDNADMELSRSPTKRKVISSFQSTENKKSKTGPKTLRQMTSDNLLHNLAAAIAGEAATATFACGGAVSVDSCNSSETPKDGRTSGVDLRWDSHCGPGGSKISFPLQQTGNDEQMLARLIADCQPVTYGVGRNASKLDNTAFSTNFHPHDCGIVDAIRQVMLPSMCAGGEGINIGTRGVKAELCNLNVCFSSLS